MRFRNLEKYKTGGSGNNITLGIPLPKTPDGRVYRFSPNEAAHPRLFLLGNRVLGFSVPEDLTPRMKHPPGTPGTICPYSGTADEDDNFMHPDDVAAAREVVAHAFHADAAAAFHGIFDDLARKTAGNKFIKVTTGRRPSPKPAPRFARNDLLRELVCDECGRDYGVYAISLFCPDCGAPNIHLHFAREVELVKEQVRIAGSLDQPSEELAYRMMGNAHEDVLTAFEATLKTVYLYRVAAREPGAADVKPVGNSFQNIERGRKRFGEFDFDPFGNLPPEALAALMLNIQKRHVIGHNLGIADATFAEHASEARLGETIPLVGDDILMFAAIGQLVVDNIDTWLADGTAPPVRSELPAAILSPPVKERPPVQIGELGSLAIRIGLWISIESEKGFGNLIREADLTQAFPDSNIDELAFAVAELESDGYLSTTSFISQRLPRMFTTESLFIEFDPHTGKSNPEIDVVQLVDLALANSGASSVGPEELHAATGWPLRRFNPAFAYMVSQIDEGRVLKGSTEDYPARGFLLIDTDRVALHRFASRLRK